MYIYDISSLRVKWTRPFRRKTKSGFCACAITFQTQSAYFQTNNLSLEMCTIWFKINGSRHFTHRVCADKGNATSCAKGYPFGTMTSDTDPILIQMIPIHTHFICRFALVSSSPGLYHSSFPNERSLCIVTPRMRSTRPANHSFH